MDKRQEHFSQRHYRAQALAGPFSFLNPTARYLRVSKPDAKRAAPAGASAAAGAHSEPSSTPAGSETGASTGADAPAKAEKAEGIYHLWRSRDNRKGRHAVVVTPETAAQHAHGVPAPTDTLRQTLRGLVKMFVRYPAWDVSYDVAVVFTLGSVIWVINAFFVWLPLSAPSTEFPGEETMGGGVTAFLGATIFEIGSVLLMLEAVNENRSADFGWALENALESTGGLVLRPDYDNCAHSHNQKTSFLKGSAELGGKNDGAVSRSAAENGGDADRRQLGAQRQWAWWPSWYELKTHYFREIGFLACFSQMIGASVFWIAGLTGLAPIHSSLSPPATNGIYWLPQVVGGTGFIVSSFFFMLETQPKWYIPAPKVLGWHIGLWNWIGAVGFTLCGALGFAANQGPAIGYASTLSTFIGSWAFLIGSAIQWYESLNKYPISIENSARM